MFKRSAYSLVVKLNNNMVFCQNNTIAYNIYFTNCICSSPLPDKDSTSFPLPDELTPRSASPNPAQ